MFSIEKLTSPFLFVTFEEKNDFKYASKLFKNASAERPWLHPSLYAARFSLYVSLLLYSYLVGIWVTLVQLLRELG